MKREESRKSPKGLLTNDQIGDRGGEGGVAAVRSGWPGESRRCAGSLFTSQSPSSGRTGESRAGLRAAQTGANGASASSGVVRKASRRLLVESVSAPSPNCACTLATDSSAMADSRSPSLIPGWDTLS